MQEREAQAQAQIQKMFEKKGAIFGRIFVCSNIDCIYIDLKTKKKKSER